MRAAMLAPSAFDRLLLPTLSKLGRILARMMPPERITALRHKIVLAGRQQTWNVEKAMAVKALGLIVGLVAGLGLLATARSTATLVAAVLLIGCGYFGMEFTPRQGGGARQLEIQQALPDVLDQISVCVEAASGSTAALYRCSLSNANALGDELGRTMQDIRLGMPRKQGRCTRCSTAPMSRTSGCSCGRSCRPRSPASPIAKVLSIQSDEVREKRRQSAEERAMKLPVKLIMPLVLCILPSLFTVIMGPAVIRMMREGAV